MKKKTLTTLAICVGSLNAGAENSRIDIRDLELTEEQRIDYEEFRKMTAKEVVNIDGLEVRGVVGNYPDTLLDSNYPDTLLDGNYPDTLLDANYPDTLLNGNYPDTLISGIVPLSDRHENIPGPSVNIDED